MTLRELVEILQGECVDAFGDMEVSTRNEAGDLADLQRQDIGVDVLRQVFIIGYHRREKA